MQSVSSRIWTRVAVSISYDDNHYTTGTSVKKLGHYVTNVIWNLIVLITIKYEFPDFLSPLFNTALGKSSTSYSVSAQFIQVSQL